MLFLKKIWGCCVKHWKLTLALIGSGIAFIIGYNRANRNAQRVKVDLELKEKDFKLAEENNEKFHKEAVQTVLDFEKKKLELKQRQDKKLKESDMQKAETKKEILNSDEKLDKILKDKWGLKKE